MTLNVHLQQLAYFLAASRAPSWSEAAKELHISQPALSQSLRELERRLGVTLFEREGRHQRLTALGEEVARFAHSVLAQTESFAGRLESMRRGRAGRLRVGMVDAACLYVLPGALQAFQEENPEVELLLTVDASGPLLAKLRHFDLDLAVVVGPAEAPDLHVRPVAEEKLHIYRKRGLRDDPHQAAWVLYPSGSHTRRLIDAGLARAGIVPRIAIESNNPQVLRQMVAMGFGWAVLPEAVANSPVAGTLETPQLEHVGKEPLLIRPLVAAIRADAPEDPRVERLLELAGQR